MSNFYAATATVRTELGLGTDTQHDAVIGAIIAQVSEAVDKYCKKPAGFFVAAGTTDSARYYDGAADHLEIDYCNSVTKIEMDEDGDGTYEATLATTDYHLYPLNESPKREVRLSSNSSYSGFASGIRKGVKITGTWGHSATPDSITRATTIWTCRLFKRRENACATMVGDPSLGPVLVYDGPDKDVKQLLEPFGPRRFAR